MTQTGLSPEQFLIGLRAYEGILAGQTGRPSESAEIEARQLIERMFDGFGAALDRYLIEQRDLVHVISLGNMIKKDGGFATWYSGPRTAVGEWPAYRRVLESRLPAEAVEDIDLSTTRILSRAANPLVPGERRKGLVIGYVQSGKTANYAGLIAKAVDAGYRIVIVLAGMYTNLRAQTQLRLESDLNLNDAHDKHGVAWSLLTGRDSDISASNGVGFMANNSMVAVMIVKKHEARLANVTAFLKSIPEETLRNRGVLIVDDESDQATPNTQGGRDLVSTINQRVRDIWKAVPTGTYVAYTATPFANIFINPSDPDDLYPDDFAMVLPKPAEYMGADRFFNVVQDADADGDEGIHSLARDVPAAEADVLAPTGRDISKFEPIITPSLAEAIRWFVLATAVRELRVGAPSHSSMLLHTSHRVGAHQLLKDVVLEFTQGLALSGDEEEAAFQQVFEREYGRASTLDGGEEAPEWAVVWAAATGLLGRLTIKIDNGQSDDRLAYPDGSPQFVIAIGGGTLSRGLTLEGLVVSYFLRTSSTYDTLLQMGRWFGFRPRYRDLVRVWVGPGLLEDYSHLARVESELRGEVAQLERELKTPRDLAIRIRNHPGRLQITAPGKMANAAIVQAGLGGTRRQTIYLDRSAIGAERARVAVRALAERAQQIGDPLRSGADSGHLLFQGLAGGDVIDFLSRYWVASSDPWLQPEAMRDWLSRHGEEASWDLLLVSGPSRRPRTEIAPGLSVNVVNRAPLDNRYWSVDRLPEAPPQDSDIVNVRALMSGADSVLDLKIRRRAGVLADADGLLDHVDTRKMETVRAVRRMIAPDRGVLLIYVVDKDSIPEDSNSKTRTTMSADAHPIGIGVVFPHAEGEDDGEFVAVDVAFDGDADRERDAAEESLGFADTEGDYTRTEA
ncbi:Z1 domain-containing protein [Homoserinibacter sp. YIM 151385]|uniref:Z1 domain-containing protein n=1 Tax=Homoserinibacter sp. YIM 151385 TaxID=2985506 RepID=UPI0022F12B8B|nr:Z1 domain-containing protein [Homoserinibacter sp. YIM 151385]WBU38028.1 Z1 domain-containing protein [Homoserinibacter sp. YIM 151385]